MAEIEAASMAVVIDYCFFASAYQLIILYFCCLASAYQMVRRRELMRPNDKASTLWYHLLIKPIAVMKYIIIVGIDIMHLLSTKCLNDTRHDKCILTLRFIIFHVSMSKVSSSFL